VKHRASSFIIRLQNKFIEAVSGIGSHVGPLLFPRPLRQTCPLPPLTFLFSFSPSFSLPDLEKKSIYKYKQIKNKTIKTNQRLLKKIRNLSGLGVKGL